MRATAVAPSNIALIKYWGKKNERLNSPAVGSISVALAALQTTTTVTFSENLSQDELYFDHRRDAGMEKRATEFLQIVRDLAGRQLFARIDTTNNFPTGAGLASSASGFAALALASTQALGLPLSSHELSCLARRGSGSAARSIFGGFVEMGVGKNDDGGDAAAVELIAAKRLPLRILVAITAVEAKEVGSTSGMKHSQETSPFYQSWTREQEKDLAAMRSALQNADFQKMGELCEYSCLKMHAVAMSSRPGTLYWNAATMALLHEVRALRSRGVGAYFTVDAGPQVKVLCLDSDETKVSAVLRGVAGVKQLVASAIGEGARLL